jgi:hypothetical protein
MSRPETMTRPEVTREDLTAAVGARRELGDESDREVIESFLDRIGTAIDARVDQRLAQRDRPRPQSRGSVPLALGSMVFGVAVTGASAGLDHSGALVAIIAWLVIGAINIAHALGR